MSKKWKYLKNKFILERSHRQANTQVVSTHINKKIILIQEIASTPEKKLQLTSNYKKYF